VCGCRSLGLTSMPCIRVNHLNETNLLRLAVNRLGENGSWGLDALKVELNELIVDGAPIEARRLSSLPSMSRRSNIVKCGGGAVSQARCVSFLSSAAPGSGKPFKESL
jgi:hypothetical protein